MPASCPSCRSGLRVAALICTSCATRVEGSFTPCPVCRLGSEDRALLELFLRCRGNAKKIERTLGLSYPTVRLRLEELWRRLRLEEAPPEETATEGPPSDRAGGRRPRRGGRREAGSAEQILRDLREGRITPEIAANRLRRRGAADDSERDSP